MLYAQGKETRPYAPMSRLDVEKVWELRNQHRGLLAVREVALYTGDQQKAERCRVQANEIQMMLKREYDVII